LQRVQPKGLDLHGLADARRDDIVAELCVHPRQLHARDAGGNQSICVGLNAISRAASVAFNNGIHRLAQPGLRRR
jgi:hypothetical protein